MSKTIVGVLNEELSFVQMVRVLKVLQKTGTLHIYAENNAILNNGVPDVITRRFEDEPRAERAALSFYKGKTVYVTSSNGDNILLTALYESGKLSSEHLKNMMALPFITDQKTLAAYLMQGYVTQQDVVRSLMRYMAKIWIQIPDWNRAPFIWRDDDMPPENILMDFYPSVDLLGPVRFDSTSGIDERN